MAIASVIALCRCRRHALEDFKWDRLAILAGLQKAQQSLMNGFRALIEACNAKPHQRRGPIERFGDARLLHQILGPDCADEMHDLACERKRCGGVSRLDDTEFRAFIREIDIVIKTAAAK